LITRINRGEKRKINLSKLSEKFLEEKIKVSRERRS